MSKKVKNNRHLFSVALFSSSLGYLKYKYAEFIKNKTKKITKEDALLLVLTKEIIDELSELIKEQTPKKMKKIIELNNLAVKMTNTEDADVYAFSILLLGVYFDDKTALIQKETSFRYKIADIADLVYNIIGKEDIERNLKIAEAFYSNLKEVCLSELD